MFYRKKIEVSRAVRAASLEPAAALTVAAAGSQALRAHTGSAGGAPGATGTRRKLNL